ncbi:MAG: hypothetical protein QHG99_00395 [Methanomicrobiales archaeon]|nr:hypothetical protein [Methanomicrobiales archaeon]
MQEDQWKELREMLSDLLWLNALLATELVQVTENTSSILRRGPVPVSCLEEHQVLREIALAIAEKYRQSDALRHHLSGHQ